MSEKKRIIVGVSGGSGIPIAVEAMRAIKHAGTHEIHLIISDSGVKTLEQETDISLEDFCGYADKCYDFHDVGASLASGTFKTDGMLIVPCSMKTAAGIACGYSDNLLLRAADVTIKEHRRLVLAAREVPLSAIHLKNLLELAQLGADIVPPMLSFYTKPETVDDMIAQTVGKLLDRFNIPYDKYKRWEQ